MQHMEQSCVFGHGVVCCVMEKGAGAQDCEAVRYVHGLVLVNA